MAYFTKNEQGEFTEVTETLHTGTEMTALREKNKELRTTNTNLLKTNESLSAFADVLDGVQNITPEGLTNKINSKASERAEQMLKAAKEKYDTEVTELKTALNTSGSQLSKLVLGAEVQKAGSKHGVVQTAYDDVLRRAEGVFIVKDGKTVPRDELARDANGNALQIDTWMETQSREAPHLFTPPKGPAMARNSNVRTPAGTNGTVRTAQERMSSGLAANAKPTSAVKQLS